MICCSIQPKDQIFVKGYGFLFFAKNMRKTIGKITSKNLSGKSSQKLLDHAKQSAADALKTTSKSLFKKTAEATAEFIGNKITNKNTKISRNLP